MGIADSPLRDRVIFIEGAPRSGTTWLIMLLATHPQIAGVVAESHLFDYGVDKLFDNFEYRHPTLRGLAHFTERAEFVDAIRDLCDAVFLSMRSHVSKAGVPEFVIEKTPVGARTDGLDLERKRELYPDAWHLHIVRDREAVIKSLMRSPFMPDHSYDACAEFRDRVVGEIHRVAGDSPRYRELPYEDLRADPVAACRGVFEWLGVDTGDEILETLRVVSRERVSELGLVSEQPTSRAAALKSRVRGALDRVLPAEAPAPAHSQEAFDFFVAVRARDEAALRALTHPKFELALRGTGSDAWLEKDEARAALIELATTLFSRKYLQERWAASAGPAEFWSGAPGRTFIGIFDSALTGDATRVDVAFGLELEDGLVRRMDVISAGPLTGRPVLEGGERAPALSVPAESL
jgi:hypothetical protein